MPSVILTILKVIGIILLVLLALVLTVLLLVLFVPVRYRVSGKYEDAPEGEAYVTWLLRLIGVRAGWKDGLYAKVRVLCFNVWSLKPGGEAEDEGNMFDGLPADDADEAGTDALPEEAAAAGGEAPAGEEALTGESAGTESLPEETSGTAEDAAESAVHRPDFTGWQAEEAAEDEKMRPWPKEPKPEKKKKPKRPPDAGGAEEAAAASPVDRIDARIAEIRKKLEALTDKAASLKKKADGALAIISHRRTQRLKDYLIKKIGRLIREIIPRKYGGFVRFGFDDPYTTGQAASAAAALYPVYQDRISVEPLFDRQEIAADLNFKGRIRLFVFVIAAAQIWFNRDFQYVFKRVRKYKKSLTEEDHG